MDVFESELRRCGAAEDAAQTMAWLAESVASTFDRLADTYRRMADQTNSPDKAARLRGHVARLNVRADAERVEAGRLHARVKTLSGQGTRDADR